MLGPDCSAPLLSILIFLPLVGALLLYVLPVFRAGVDPDGNRARIWALLVGAGAFVVNILALLHFNPGQPGFQLQEEMLWIPSFGISYVLGVDGMSLLLMLLTTFLMPLIFLASSSVNKKRRGYLFHMLALETAMLGTLAALDIFLFYVFWELMLAPMYFIIGLWGGKRRIYATLKFVLYTVFGSLLMLVAIFYLIWQYQAQHNELSFLLRDLVFGTRLSLQEELWLFAAFALAFAIKVPLFPFHTWLPDAHVEAPTGGSVVLAGVLLKMGLYGLLRFAYPLFPRAAEVFAPWIAVLAVIGIIYGALVAWAQKDVKKLVAYSSVSHLGFCVLGFVAFNVISVSGSVYQMLSHGISTGALFFIVGILYERRHTREISEYGGLAAQMPLLAFFFMIFTLSSIALPLTNGFVGEFLILVGSFGPYPVLTSFAVLGVILGAVYMLTLYLRTMFGELDKGKNGNLPDITRNETAILAPLAVMVFVMGLFPGPFMKVLEPSVAEYVVMVDERRNVLAAHHGQSVPTESDLNVLKHVAVQKGEKHG